MFEQRLYRRTAGGADAFVEHVTQRRRQFRIDFAGITRREFTFGRLGIDAGKARPVDDPLLRQTLMALERITRLGRIFVVQIETRGPGIFELPLDLLRVDRRIGRGNGGQRAFAIGSGGQFMIEKLAP
jgi:hypothetical protein